MTWEEKPLSQAALDDEAEHMQRLAEELTANEAPSPPDVVRRRELSKSLLTFGSFLAEKLMPIDARVEVIEKAAGRNITKFACMSDLISNLTDRVSQLENETRVRFMGVWQPGFSYAKGSLVTHDGSMWYCLCGTSSTKPGTGEGAGKASADWQLVVKRGRDARDR